MCQSKKSHSLKPAEKLCSHHLSYRLKLHMNIQFYAELIQDHIIFLK